MLHVPKHIQVFQRKINPEFCCDVGTFIYVCMKVCIMQVLNTSVCIVIVMYKVNLLYSNKNLLGMNY